MNQNTRCRDEVQNPLLAAKENIQLINSTDRSIDLYLLAGLGFYFLKDDKLQLFSLQISEDQV